MKRNRLSVFILVAMFIGILAGYILNATAPTPEAAKSIAANLNLITTIFLRLIKMVIAPLVFSGLIVGLAATGDAKTVGRLGGKSLTWFFGASLVSLSVGLILASCLQIGHAVSLRLPPAWAGDGVSTSTFNLQNFIIHIFPSSIFQAMSDNEILPILVFSLFFGLGLSALKDQLPGVILEVIEGVFKIMLKVTNYVMLFAPLGVFAAVASVITVNGLGILVIYAKFILSVYFGMAVLCALLIGVSYAVIGKSIFVMLRLMREPMIIAFSTASSEAIYPMTIEQLTRSGIHPRISTFVLPLAYSFNLDGAMMFQAFAVVFIAQAFNIDLSIGKQISMLLIMMLTSKGVAGVPRAAIVVIAATLPLFGLPAEGVVLLLAIDQFIDMGRTTTNVVGNSIAVTMIARSENALQPWNGRDYPVEAGTSVTSELASKV